MVNDARTGEVFIRRLTLLDSVYKMYEYEYVVIYPINETRKGRVQHKYSDGALVLIEKVLTDIRTWE